MGEDFFHGSKEFSLEEDGSITLQPGAKVPTALRTKEAREDVRKILQDLTEENPDSTDVTDTQQEK